MAPLTGRGRVVDDPAVDLLGYDRVADRQHDHELVQDRGLPDLLAVGARARGLLRAALQDVLDQLAVDLGRVVAGLRAAGGQAASKRTRYRLPTGPSRSPRTTGAAGGRDSLVELAGDGAALELHDVAGEGAGLVGEDVADHAELLVQVRGPGHGGRVALRVVHLDVHVDEGRLDVAHDLQGHLQRYRDQVVEEDEEGHEVEGEVLRLGICGTRKGNRESDGSE